MSMSQEGSDHMPPKAPMRPKIRVDRANGAAKSALASEFWSEAKVGASVVDHVHVCNFSFLFDLAALKAAAAARRGASASCVV